MDPSERTSLEVIRGWAEAGRRFALATVARTWGSAPRPAGAWMAVREDGVVQGSVSGGCVEEEVIAALSAGRFSSTAAELLKYGVSQEAANRRGLPCGGAIEIVLEPRPEPGPLIELARRVARGERVRRRVTVGETALSLDPLPPGAGGDAASEEVAWDGRTLVVVFGPAWRLLLVGGGELADCLARLARHLDYSVEVCEPRPGYAASWAVEGARLGSGMPDDAVRAFAPDARSAVVTLTHDPGLDDLALLEALRSPAFYVGALGSRATNERRRERLREHFGLAEAELARLHGPVGLAIGGRTPAEIALSVLAEMTALRRGLRTEDGVIVRRAPARDGSAEKP